MIKSILTLGLFLTNSFLFAQPFGGISVTSKGNIFQVGILTEAIEVTAVYKIPFSRTDEARILSFSLGKLFFITRKPENNYSATVSIGISKYMIKDFEKYHAVEEGIGAVIVTVKEVCPIYGLEVGKDSYMGRVFAGISYCKSFYFGIGMKFFPYR